MESEFRNSSNNLEGYTPQMRLLQQGGVYPPNSSRPAFQSSIKTVNRLVIDAQGVAEAFQRACIHGFFTLNPNFIVSGLSLAFPEDLSFEVRNHVFLMKTSGNN